MPQPSLGSIKDIWHIFLSSETTKARLCPVLIENVFIMLVRMENLLRN